MERYHSISTEKIMSVSDLASGLLWFNWKHALEDSLGVSERSARRMAQGQIPIPPAEQTRVASLLRAEARRLDAMAHALEADTCA